MKYFLTFVDLSEDEQMVTKIKSDLKERFEEDVYLKLSWHSISHPPAYELFQLAREISSLVCYSEEQVKKIKIETIKDTVDFFVIEVNECLH